MNNIQSLVNKDSIIVKDNYTNLEILNYTNYFKTHLLIKCKNKECQDLIDKYISNKRDILISNICYINSVLKKHGLKDKICHSGKKVNYMKDEIKKKLKNIETMIKFIKNFKINILL